MIEMFQTNHTFILVLDGFAAHHGDRPFPAHHWATAHFLRNPDVEVILEEALHTTSNPKLELKYKPVHPFAKGLIW